MEISGAEYRDGCLVLRTADPEAIRFAYTFQPGNFRLERAKKRRSLDANAYCWVLVDKIAEALRIGKEEVYRKSIRDIGGVSETVCVRSEAVQKLCESWRARGIGWQTEEFPSKLDGCTNVTLYYGSSCYDAHQMSVLIDHLVQDAQALGIETLPPYKLQAMMEAYER